jgi:hypothetical protein
LKTPALGLSLVALLTLGCRRAEHEPSQPTYVLEAPGLPGLWQVMPDMASGWAETFQFFSDGRYSFHYSQMDCARRETSYDGHYALRNDSLLLTVEYRHVLIGGHLEAAMGSCGSDSALTDDARESVVPARAGTHIALSATPPETVSVTLRDYRIDRDVPRPMWRMTLGGRTYWKLRSDPNDYR